MKFAIPFIFCIIYATNLSAQLEDTIIEARWNGHAFVNSSRTIKTYDAACNLLTERGQSWYDGSSKWTNDYLMTYTYYGRNVATRLRQNWNGISKSWSNLFKETNTYNDSNLVSGLTESWRADSWQDSTLKTIIYNANGEEAKAILQTWDTILRRWQKSAQTVFAYNADKTIKHSAIEIWDTATLKWINLQKQIYRYSNGNTSQIETQSWDTLAKAWLNQSKDIFTDSTTIFQIWQDNKWMDIIRNTFVYDKNHFLIKNFSEIWNNNGWGNAEQVLYTNNAEGKPLKTVYQRWDAGGSRWLNEFRFTISYIPGCTAPIAFINLNAGTARSYVTTR